MSDDLSGAAVDGEFSAISRSRDVLDCPWCMSLVGWHPGPHRRCLAAHSRLAARCRSAARRASVETVTVTAGFRHDELTHPQHAGAAPTRRRVERRSSRFWFDGYSDPNPPIYPPTYPPAPGPPPPGDGGAADADQSMTINGGALFTNDPDVTLSVIAPSWAAGFESQTTAASAMPRASRSRRRSAGISPSPVPSACPRRSTCVSAATLRTSRTTSSSTRPTRP